MRRSGIQAFRRSGFGLAVAFVLGCGGAADVIDAPLGQDVVTYDAGADAPPPPPPCVVGKACDDGNPCTLDDHCDAGACVGAAMTCDDGRACTKDDCDGKGGCDFAVRGGFCLIDNVCRTHGQGNAVNACEACDTDASKIGWTKQQDLDACEDGNPCTFGDYCKKGECKKGLKAACDDESACTLDGCDPLVGCTHQPISGACDDGDPCTPASVCSGGVCHAPKAACDDGSPCTTDTCLPTGCEHVALQGACEDGDACTGGDACQDGQCVPGPAKTCDDGSECTVDHCDPLFGCYQTLTGNPCCAGAVHFCDDGDPCTTDDCVAGDKGCVNTPNTAPCDDQSPCTLGDSCQGGTCSAGAAAACDDGNPCTSDACSEAAGCQHVPSLGACNDGIDCTTSDACQGGSCAGDKSQCKCSPAFSSAVAKLTSLQLGKSGQPGQGIDVDQKASTCAPAADCSGGVDNALSPVSAFLNDNLAKAISKAQVILVLELQSPKTDGSQFTVALYAGKLADKSCDHNTKACDYLVDPATLTEDCGPLIVLDNARIKGGKLTAGGPGYNFPLLLPLFGDQVLEVAFFNGTVVGDITLSGGKVTAITSGVLGGAIPKATFAKALELVPDGQLPAPKETIVQLLDLLITDDIDTGPPAGADAASAGFLFQAIGGSLVGVDD